MKYFEMFTGIAGFTVGIERAYDKSNKHESTKPEPSDGEQGRLGSADEGGRDVLSANDSAFRRNAESDGRAECIGFSEIARVPCGILRYRYPNIKNYGNASGLVPNINKHRDTTNVIPDELADFDLLCGGFPCQSWSIAGKRQGFDDARGTLFYEIARVLSHKRPGHFLLENVKGLLSADGGQAFAEILRILTELGYRVETVVLNSKHFGVPQNRERVFFIGHLGGECGREILSFGESGEELARQVGQRNDTAHTITNDDKARGSYVVASSPEIYAKNGEKKKNDNFASTLTAGAHSGGNHSDTDLISVGTLRTHKDGEGFREVASGNCRTIPARAREDGSGQPVVVIPVLTPDRPTKRQNGRRMKNEGEARFTLTAQDKHGVMLEKLVDGAQGQRVYDAAVPAASLRTCANGGNAADKYQVEKRIRRLTPVECARLQGFPDDWADFGLFENKNGEWNVREISDTGKYQVFGNAVTTNVIKAIISRMLEKGCLT